MVALAACWASAHSASSDFIQQCPDEMLTDGLADGLADGLSHNRLHGLVDSIFDVVADVSTDTPPRADAESLHGHRKRGRSRVCARVYRVDGPSRMRRGMSRQSGQAIRWSERSSLPMFSPVTLVVADPIVWVRLGVSLAASAETCEQHAAGEHAHREEQSFRTVDVDGLVREADAGTNICGAEDGPLK